MTPEWPTDAIVWLTGLLLTLLSSGKIVSLLLREAGKAIPAEETNPGRVIGKLENVLVFFFVAAGAYTALAIIFAAKGMVRTPKHGDDASYYILGTLANFTWALLVAGMTYLMAQVLV